MNTAIANIENQPLKAFAERAYLDYSMYVILGQGIAAHC